MNIHNKQFNQHPNSNGSPFMCSVCNKTFLKASSLNTHMISHTAKLYCYACNINFDDDAVTYSQHMQVTHNVIMTKDLISRAKANLQRSESMHQASVENVNGDETEQPRLMEVFQVQSSSSTNGQIPKLKITIKKEPVVKKEKEIHLDGHLSDSSSSSSSSSNSSSSSSSSGSSSSSTSNDEKNDNNNRLLISHTKA